MINIRTKAQIDELKAASKIVGETLQILEKEVCEGISLLELDKIAEDYIRSKGAKPAFKGLYGFPNAVCISVNEVIIHGIPNDYKLKNGDIVGLDLGAELNGWFGDAAITCGVGEISQKDKDLIACSKDSLYAAIDHIREGMRFKELSAFIESEIKKRGFVPLEGFCGHGIGRSPHEEPSILNYIEKGGNAKGGEKIKNGMVFCIEPMICQKSGEPKVAANKWDVSSADGLNGSHYEHTIAVVNGRAEILSLTE